MPTTISKLGEKLHADRRRSRLTQEQVAAEMDVSRQLVSRWESGASVPDVVQLAQLAHRYNRGVDGYYEAVEIDLTRSGEGESPIGSRYPRAEQPSLFDEPEDLQLPEITIDLRDREVPSYTLRSPSDLVAA